MNKTSALTPAEKNSSYRARMRKKGLRLVQLWVLNNQQNDFLKTAKKQSVAASTYLNAQEELKEIDAIQADNWNWK